MDNKYLDYLQSNPQAAEPAPTVNQPTANPYSEYLQSEKRKALRSSMVSAMDVEPDAAGKARRLAQQSGIPAAVVERNLPDVERQVQLQQFDGLVTESPRLANELQNPEFAKIARDDLDVLKRMESKLYGGMKPIERGFFGAITEPVQRGFARARGSISIIASELGLYDGAPEELAVNLAQRNREVERFPMPANVADGLTEITQYSRLGETAKAAGAIIRNPQSVLEVTLESLGASSPGIAAFALGSAFGPVGGAVGAGTGSFAVEYANTINEVVTESGGSTTDAFSIGRAMANPEVMEAAREKALKRGIPIALFDALTAGVAGRLLAGATSSTGSVAARTAGELGIQATGGAAGEATAQGLTGEFNPGEILLEAFAEIPTAIIEVPANYRDARGAARMRDTIAAAEKVQQQIQAQVNQAQGAEQNAQVLRDMAADSSASKARERDPKAFEQYIDRVVEDGPVQDLYIDVQTLVNKLNQSGISVAELSQASPSVAAQLPEALAAGGDIVIPVSEYMARVAGTGLDEALIPSLRTDVSAMSEEQAQVFYQEQTQVFQQEAERVIGQQAQTDAFMESADQVEGQLLEQLNKAGRFQPRSNELKASFAKSFYSTLADTLGVTPTEAFERYPLQIRADFLPDLAGGGRFDQAKADEPVMDFEQAREYFKANLQGKEIDRPGLGKVRITGKGWKKFKGGVKADPSKTDLLQFIPDVIQSGEYIGRFPLDKVRSDDIVAFHHIQKTVQLRGNDVRVGVTLGEDQFGNLFYNINRDPDALLQKKKGSDVTGEIAPGSEPSEGANTLSQSVLDDGSEVNIEILEQGERGSIAFGNDITQTPSVLTLAAGSDLSTFFHESGHFFLEVYSDLASRPDAPARVQSDMAAILDWMGVKGSPELTPLQQWRAMSIDERRPMHEKFARGFEAYLIKGEAPSLELRDAFRTFSAWIKNVYKNLLAQFRGNTDRALDTNLSPEIRQVMDRMLATDAQIQQAEFARSMFPTVQTAEEAGMNQEQWEAYQAKGKDATATAVEQLQRKSLADMKWFANAKGKAIKEIQARARDIRKQMMADVTAEVMARPIYQAWQFLKSKSDGPDTPAGKFSVEALSEMYGGKGDSGFDKYALLDWQRLTSERMTSAKEGIHPDYVADMFGFSSGDDLVRMLIKAEKPSEVIERLTDERLLQEYSELATAEQIERAAEEAIHNDARARFVATELEALNQINNQRERTPRGGSVNLILKAAKQFARDIVGRKKLKDIRPSQFANAESKAGREAMAAQKAGDYAALAQAKRNQVLNGAVTKEAVAALDEIAKIRKFFTFVTKGNNKTLVEKGRNPDIVNAARAILSAYGLAPRLKNSAQEYMEVLKREDPRMFESLNPSVERAIADAKPLNELTLDELRVLNQEIDSMWNAAKRMREIEIDGKKVNLDDIAAAVGDRINEIGVPSEVPGEKSALTDQDRARKGLQFAGALLRRVEQWAEAKDGKFGGPFLRYIFQPVKEAADRYRTDRMKYRKQYAELVKEVAPNIQKGKIEAPELGYTFGAGKNGVGTAELLHAILHTGNESNKRKLLLGRKWATQNPDGSLDTSRWDNFINRMHADGLLKKEHYDFAQGVWDLLEEMKPLAQKAHRDVYGRYFDEVTADGFDTPFGVYKGGYVPAQADPEIVPDAALRKLAEAENENMAFSFPSTSKGFTKSRTEYNRPLVLDLRTLAQHIDKVLLFSHMEAPVRDVQRLLMRKEVSYGLNRMDPAAYEGMLIPWLNRSARQQVETPIVGDGRVSRVLSVVRNRAGMQLMFGNISNTLQQITGFVSIFGAGIKPSYIKRATAQYISNPRKTSELVAEASIAMRDRMQNEIAAINDSMSQILLNPTLYQNAQAWSQKHAYFLQAAFDNVISPIVWLGAYNQALSEKMSDQDAVRFADGVVRKTQGSNQAEDVSRIETGPAYARMSTQFFGHFNMVANTTVTGLQQVASDVGLVKGAGRALGIVFFGVLAPAWIAEAIAIAFRGGPEDEDDDGYLDDWLSQAIGMGTLKTLLAGIPFVGQLANAGINRFNGNPMDDRVGASPAVSLLESSVGAPSTVYKAMVEDGSKARAVKDVATAVGIVTGLPAMAASRPISYLVGVADGQIEPTSPVDAVRGLVTGTPSKESRQ